VKAAIKYCIENEILIQFMKNHSSEIINMLFDEISIDRIIEIRVNEAVEDTIEEAVREAVSEAVKNAREEARDKGREEGLEIGREEEKLEIARNLIAKGSTRGFVHEITGLSIDEIQRL
jgi:predicted transposase/invertase (TIGR01784 family)